VACGRRWRGYFTSDFNPHRQASGLRIGAAEEAFIQCSQHGHGIAGPVESAADRSDEEGHQHSGFEALAGYVSGDDQQTAVGFVGNDLEEVAATSRAGGIRSRW